MDTFQCVLDFHRRFGAYIGKQPEFPPDEVLALRDRLIQEEFDEYREAVAKRDLVKAADSLADLTYVVLGTAVALGIDLRPVFAEVHRTNMLKEGGATREDGKILKPPGWEPPQIAPLLENMRLG
ncbi:MAG: hypothetical protein CW346_12075 [Bacillaceae bacterium]|nr:hypothetical protein [Bacillaceae bacterium]